MKVGEGHILTAVHNKSFESGDRLVEFGETQYTGGETSIELPTNLTAIEAAFFAPKAVAVDVATMVYGTDGVITNGAVTVARPSGGSAVGVYYVLIGYRRG